MADQQTTYSNFAIAITLIFYCVSGTLLTIVNKLAIIAYPYANSLLVFQNGVTAILLLLGSYLFPGTFQSMPKITFQIIRNWGPLVLLFVCMLVTSLLALLEVSAVTLIVMRNLSTLLVAFFERLVLGEEIKLFTWLALIGILIGAILYGARDMTFTVLGYFWLMINVLSTSAYQIYVKKLISQSKELGPFGMSYINNVLSIPAFILIGIGRGVIDEGKYENIFLMFTTDISTSILIITSALLGFSLSTSAFMVNKMISATSMMVANNVNKFAVIILSEIFVERTLDSISTIGTILVMFFGWFYSKTRSSTFQVSCWQKNKEQQGYQLVPTTSTGSTTDGPEKEESEKEQEKV